MWVPKNMCARNPIVKELFTRKETWKHTWGYTLGRDHITVTLLGVSSHSLLKATWMITWRSIRKGKSGHLQIASKLGLEIRGVRKVLRNKIMRNHQKRPARKKAEMKQRNYKEFPNKISKKRRHSLRFLLDRDWMCLQN